MSKQLWGWSAMDDAQLRTLGPTHSLEALSHVIGRTREAISMRLKKLKIERRYVRAAPTRLKLAAALEKARATKNAKSQDPSSSVPWPRPNIDPSHALKSIVYGIPKESQSNPVSGHRFVSRATVGSIGCSAAMCLEAAQ